MSNNQEQREEFSIPTGAEFAKDPATPRWVKDLIRFLPVKSQFLLSGNIRDRYPFPYDDSGYTICDIGMYLTEALALEGYEYSLTFDRTRLSLIVRDDHDLAAAFDFFKRDFDIEFDDESRSCELSLEKSIDVFGKVTQWRKNHIVVFADFASRYVVRPDSLQECEHDYFTEALRLSHAAKPHITCDSTIALFNPIIWLCDKENDLPSWFSVENSRIRSIIVPKPDHILRRCVVDGLSPHMEEYESLSEEQKKNGVAAFVEQTEGMLVTDLIAITQLCRREKLPFREIGEAVRRYKLGVTEDPWRRMDRRKIVEGEKFLERRVKGQRPAVTKALDIIKRAMTGLSGSQGARLDGRPRGVMFLAGPTGTGKTELAKTLTELLFGDEGAYIRFDMSEFSQEHSDQRLIGAPPGYIGSDMGGELTNAVREKPFSVILFDEIEKAHGRILDKFLQILDDGVLTSGRGERVYFSESVIIFTSNLGMSSKISIEQPDSIVTPKDSYPEVERKVRGAIENYFKEELGRPEILNRIGENIVVFDFIRQDVAEEIFEIMVERVRESLDESMGLELILAEEANKELLDLCTKDLGNGGRGVRNQIEAFLINPLSREIFDRDIKGRQKVTINSIEYEKDGPRLSLEMDDRR